MSAEHASSPTASALPTHQRWCSCTAADRPAGRGLRTNLRRRGDRWYWHWDPKFITENASLPPSEVSDVDRMHGNDLFADPVLDFLVRHGV